MKQWESFFKSHHHSFIKTGNVINNAIKRISLEIIYQNFKERLLDELSQEMDKQLKLAKKENKNEY